MLVVGLTGNIGSGKSTVARLLEAREIPVIDADALAREAVEPGSAALAAIVKRWGPRVLGAGGALDRAALRRIVFVNPADRAALDAMVHPEIRRRRDAHLARYRELGSRVVVCDIPLLFEKQLEGDADVILLVDAPPELRLARLERDRGLSRTEALEMIDAQLPSSEKRPRSDYIIDNDGTLETLRARFDETWKAIEREHLG